MSANPHPYHQMGRMAPPPKNNSSENGSSHSHEQKQVISTKATRPERRNTQPKQNTGNPNKKSLKGKIIITIIIIGVLYLFSMAFCAFKFNSLNPFRSLFGVMEVVSDKRPYVQVASFPYEAYVANPETSKTDLFNKMEEEGFTYMELESIENNYIFGKDEDRIRVVVSGNDKFSRWVFSQVSEIKVDSSLSAEEA